MMKTTAEQIRQIKTKRDALKIYADVKADDNFINFAKKYVFTTEHRVSRNALWILTQAQKNEIAQLQSQLNQLIDLAMQTADSAVRRLSLNIVERLELRQDDPRVDFLDYCLEHMVRIDETSATQAVCMKLAHRMCLPYPELIDELKHTLENMDMNHYKPAAKCIRTKILSNKLQQKYSKKG